MSQGSFDRLIGEAGRQSFSGWDFSYIAERMRQQPASWDYSSLVQARLPRVQSLLDLGTGGGEVLSALVPLPAHTVAIEAYSPNVEIARARLSPLGVEVVEVEGGPDNAHIVPGQGIGTLPFPDENFGLVIDRHTSYYPSEVHRILQPGAAFITQQVGAAHLEALNQLLGVPRGYNPRWTMEFAVRQLEEAGFHIADRRQEFPEVQFSDIGAVAYYLRVVPWQVPDFPVQRYRDRLEEIHERIAAEGVLRLRGHFFYLEAVKP